MEVLRDAKRERAKLIGALHRQGHSLAAIGKLLGVSKQRVSQLYRTQDTKEPG